MKPRRNGSTWLALVDSAWRVVLLPRRLGGPGEKPTADLVFKLWPPSVVSMAGCVGVNGHSDRWKPGAGRRETGVQYPVQLVVCYRDSVRAS